MALSAAEVADRLGSAELRLEQLLALRAPRRWRWFGPRTGAPGIAGADARTRLRLAQEFLFHAIGAVDVVAQIVDDRRALGLSDPTVRTVCARIAQVNAADPILTAFGGLGQQTRGVSVPANPYADDALLFRAMLYRHSVVHAHVHPFVFVAGGPDDVHLRIDPRLAPNDPPYGPNGNISTKPAASELRRVLTLCRARLPQVLALA